MLLLRLVNRVSLIIITFHAKNNTFHVIILLCSLRFDLPEGKKWSFFFVLCCSIFDLIFPFNHAIIALERFRSQLLSEHHTPLTTYLTMENAVEACMKLPESERKIKVQASVRQNRFLLRISNSFNGVIKKTEGLPITEL